MAESVFNRSLSLIIDLRVVVTLVLLSVLLDGTPAQAQVTVEMTADRTQITTDQSIVVRITVESSGTSSPEIELPSFDDFEVIQQQVSRPMQFSFSFGRGAQQVVRSTTNYTFVLSPQSTGRFVIQPVRVKVGGQTLQSKPLTITVSGGSAPQIPADTPNPNSEPTQPQPDSDYLDGASFDENAFIRTVVDKAEAYVGEQITVTIYLYLRGRLSSQPNIETEPDTEGFWVHDLLPRNYRLDAQRQTVGGRIFRVYALRRFAAFALRSGQLTIGPMTLSMEQGTLFDLFRMGGGSTLRRTGVPVTINIKPLPDGSQQKGEIAVGRFEVAAKLDREEVPTGDAVTLAVTVKGEGNLRTVNIPTPHIEGLQILQPEVRDLIESPNDLVGGTRIYEWLIIPREPGKFKIGPIAVQTFDPEKKIYVLSQSPPLWLTAAGSKLQGHQAEDPSESHTEAQSAEASKHKFGPIRTSSSLRRNKSRLISEPYYAWLLALGPLGWLAVLVISVVRSKLAANSEKSAPRRAARQARKRLAQAVERSKKGDVRGFYSTLASAIKGMLEARLEEAVGGYTHDELRSHLVQRGMTEQLSRQIIEELENCELSRFSSAGNSPQEIERSIKRSQSLFQQLAGFTPDKAETRQ